MPYIQNQQRVNELADELQERHGISRDEAIAQAREQIEADAADKQGSQKYGY